ncbi:hypothetical protein [Sodalis sp. RH19]|uniref:hypothetical protein n=1 Tax=Sodalis sp. RH19 TaxID=3394334 RepID=UPI0039B6E40C
MNESRLGNTIRNARVSLFFYLIILLVTFYSRSFFIKQLGSDFVGLTTTMLNIIGFLNLAEMGFASVIAFALYKPLLERNKEETNEIVSVFGYIYRLIGYIIIFFGILLAIGVLFFFKNSGFDSTAILTVYLTYLITTLLGFFVNYKEVLLVADQKNYIKISIYNNVRLAKIAVQMLAINYISDSIYLWIILELIFLSSYSIFLNLKIKRIYPNLTSVVKQGKELSHKYAFIFTKAKQAFFHKFSTLILQNTANVFVYFFSSLNMVTKYSNYIIISASIVTLLSSLFDSTNAAVGNLVAEKNTSRVLKVYWELQVSRFWLATSVVFTCFITIDIFISSWVGNEFILDTNIKLFIILNLFIMIIRKTNDEFLGACGLFKDIWAPITEIIINVAVMIICGRIWGVIGIPLGAFISMGLIVIIWKPFFLYREFMPQKISIYVINLAKYIIISLCTIYVVSKIPLFNNSAPDSYYKFLCIGVQRFFEMLIVSWILFIIFTDEMRDFSKRFYKIIRK